MATRTAQSIGSTHPTAQADSFHAKRQHLAADAFEFTSPVLQLLDMLLPAVAPYAPPAECHVSTTELKESLYDRPPPSASLL
ncbi:MAG: hypothetical protein WCC22_13710 [Terriglobales bacterium]